MDNGTFQYVGIKLLTEKRDAVKGGQNSNVSIPDGLIIKRMDTRMDTEERFVDKTPFENRLMTTNFMIQYSLTGKGSNVKLEGLNVHKLVQRASEKQKPCVHFESDR